MNLGEEIDVLIRARYALLWILTSEERRACDLLKSIADHRGKRYYEWSCQTGMAAPGVSLQSKHLRDSPTRDPLAALNFIIDQVDPAIYVLKDFHPFLTKNRPDVIRRLKEIAQELKLSYKTAIILSPTLDIPLELEKETTVLVMPPPTREDLHQLIRGIGEQLQGIDRERLAVDPTETHRLVEAALGLTLAEAENVFAKILIKHHRLSANDVSDVLEEKRQIVRKNGLLEWVNSEENLDSVGGLDRLKQWLQKRSLAFTEEARAFGLPSPRGVLLLGIQGCGKSLCAKAVARHWNLPLLRFDMGRMFGSFVGSSEENVRRALHLAESIAPAALWIDEIDKAISGARSAEVGDSGTSSRVLATFLTWLSEKKAPVFVIASANDISRLPPEFLRKGRFDEIFFVDLPSETERAAIFKIHLARRRRDPSAFDAGQLAARTAGFSGGEIEQLIIEALFDAFAAREELNQGRILTALEQAVPLSTTMSEHVTELRSWARGRARLASDDSPVELEKA